MLILTLSTQMFIKAHRTSTVEILFLDGRRPLSKCMLINFNQYYQNNFSKFMTQGRFFLVLSCPKYYWF